MMRSVPLLLLVPSLALAGRYDPTPDRAALRQAATAAHDSVVTAAGLALEPEKAAAIKAGLEEGLRQARLAAEAAKTLDAAAEQRAAEMTAAVREGALAGKIKKISEPTAAERRRWEQLSADREDLKKKVDALPHTSRESFKALLATAADALKSADEALRSTENFVDAMGARSLEMKEAQRRALETRAETALSVAETVRQADALSAPTAEAEARLGSLGQEPRELARSRAALKLNPLCDITRLLCAAADTACNRADDFRRFSAGFEKASLAFEKARSAANVDPAEAKSFLDKAQNALAQVRERLQK